MRQAGIVAAAGIESPADLGHLAEDHENAAHLADCIDRETDFVAPTPDTNILFVETEPAGVAASDVVDRLAENDVRAQPVGERAIRLCTHCDVSRADVKTTADHLADAF